MNKEAYKRFHIRLISLTLLAALIPLVVLAAVLYFPFAQIHSRQLQTQFLSEAQARARVVDGFLQQQIALLATIADTHSLETLTRQGVLIELLATINRRAGAFMDLAVIDASGRRQAYAGPFDLKDQWVNRQPWFSSVMTDATAVSDLASGDRQTPHFVIAVRRLDKTPAWILAAAIDPQALRALIRSPRAGFSGDVFIVNRAGIYQTRSRAGGQILELSDIDTAAFGERTSVVGHQDAKGKQLMAAGSWLAYANWLLVITRPADEGMRPLSTERNWAIVIIICGLFFIGLVAFIHTTVTVRILEDAAMRRQELEHQLLRTYKLATLGEIAADIVHEINNPVAVINEKAGWMKDLLPDARFQPAESQKEFESSIAGIEQQVKRIRQIVRNILGFARRKEGQEDEVNVNTVLDQTAELLQDQSRAQHISIHRRLDPDLPVIAGDPVQLQEVIVNLIHNAMDAIGEDGNIHLASRRSGEFIEIDIRDDGPGIPPAQIGRIFDTFYTTKPKGKGTGLGLSISHTIVRQMGGLIRVDSTVGKGTTFTVRLPAESAKA